MTGDQFFRSPRPPWVPEPWPVTVPREIIPQPYRPWPVDQVKELKELLERVKALEEKVMPCPCEPNKADYIQMCADRIAELERGSP